MNNTKSINPLLALSSIDGRYSSATKDLSNYLSEYALIKKRLLVEITYLKYLSELKIIRLINKTEIKTLDDIHLNFDIEDAERVKSYESKLNHDVKSVEVFLREKLKNTSLKDLVEYIHLGLTSEDINNISYRSLLDEFNSKELILLYKEVLNNLLNLADRFSNLPMLARTHGQPGVPTTLGKEIIVFAERISTKLEKLDKLNFYGKLNGAVGNYNAISIIDPNLDWEKFSTNFLEKFDLKTNLVTTQIAPYDDIIEYLQTIQNINNSMIDLNQDIWRYISDGYFKQKLIDTEVGSSTMPQKINPIFFENSEGNLGLSNANIDFFTRKLSVSRLQRDLSDSTVIRNLNYILALSYIAYKNLLKGLDRISVDEEKIKKDLNSNWSILSEALQTALRASGKDDPYTLIKRLTRGKNIDINSWVEILEEANISPKYHEQLKNLSPDNYLGFADNITKKAIKQIKSLHKI